MRWIELLRTIKYHSQMACWLHAPTVFFMLNPPWNANLPQQFLIGQCGIDQSTLFTKTLTIALQTLHNLPRPVEVTRFTKHIQQVHMDVTSMTTLLQASCGCIVIVIVTDSLPSGL